MPILSILIPTYNRAGSLRECLESLAREEVVSNGSDVEVMISDNCSTDETQAVCEYFVTRFPGKFVYVRHERNMGGQANFTYLISHGRGRFLKFQQDKFAVEPGAVGKIVEIVKKHEAEHPVLYFGNEYMVHLPVGVYPIRSFDELADTVSYWTTWIGGYGLWRDEVDVAVPIQDKYAATLLQQVAVIWNLFSRNKVGYLYNFKQYHNCQAAVTNDGGYNVAEVFSENYLGMLREFLHPGGLSKAAFEREKKRLYFGHIYGMYFDFEHCFRFKKGDFLRHTKDFHNNWYYWMSLAAVPAFRFVGNMSPTARQKFFTLIRWVREKVVAR